MDKIFLHGMKADTLIGVYDWERQHKQTLILDLDIVLPENSHQDDNIEHTIHYGEVCQLIRQQDYPLGADSHMPRDRQPEKPFAR